MNRDKRSSDPALLADLYPFLIREASALDLAHIQAWLPEALGGTPAAKLAIATDAATGAVAGVAALRVFVDRVGRFLLYVAPDFRRRGCGTALLNWIQEAGSRAQATAIWTARSYEVGATDSDSTTARAFFQARQLSVAQEVVRYRAELRSALAVLEPLYTRWTRSRPDAHRVQIVPVQQVDSGKLASFAVRQVGGIPEEVVGRLNNSGPMSYSHSLSMAGVIGEKIVGTLLVRHQGNVAYIETRAVEQEYRGGWLNLALMYHSAVAATAFGCQTIEFEHDIVQADTFKLAQRFSAIRTGCRQCRGLPRVVTAHETEQAAPTQMIAPDALVQRIRPAASPGTVLMGAGNKPTMGWQDEALRDSLVAGQNAEKVRERLFFDSANDIIHLLSARGIEGVSVNNHARGLTLQLKLVPFGAGEPHRTTRLKTSLLLATLPGSAGQSICETLATGLGLDVVSIGPSSFPHAVINPRLAPRLSMPGTICHIHADARIGNLAPINSFLDRMVVHVGDPREAMVSGVYQLQSLHRDGGVCELASFGLPLPNTYFDLQLAEQFDFMIEHGLPDLVRWIEGWRDAAANSLFRTRVLFTRDDDLGKNPPLFFRSILEHYGISDQVPHFQPFSAGSGVQARDGSPESWRTVLTVAQRQAVSERVPRRLLEYFDWPVG